MPVLMLAWDLGTLERIALLEDRFQAAAISHTYTHPRLPQLCSLKGMRCKL